MQVIVNGQTQVIEVASDAYQVVVNNTPTQVISVGTQGPQGPAGPGQAGFTFLLAQSSPLATGTNLTNILPAGATGSITNVYAVAKTGPTGQAAIFDILVNGTSIWSANPGNRIQIASGQTEGTQTNVDNPNISLGNLVTVNCDQVGSTQPGQNITILVVIN